MAQTSLDSTTGRLKGCYCYPYRSDCPFREFFISSIRTRASPLKACCQERCHTLGIWRTLKTPYDPRGNGWVKCTNHTLKVLLRVIISRETVYQWDTPACKATVYMSTKQASHSMVTGRELWLLSDSRLPLVYGDVLPASPFMQCLR